MELQKVFEETWQLLSVAGEAVHNPTKFWQ
jgi:hypothetical protein